MYGCQLSGTVPQDFCDALIVTIYKRKGDWQSAETIGDYYYWP